MNQSKIFTSFFWSALNTGGSQILGLLFGILLARLLSPEDFGIMAIIIFTTLIANIFVDSGLSHALIRDQNTTSEDYDSVFYFSVTVGVIFSVLLYSLSNPIALFYSKPILDGLIKVMSISPLIYSLMSINSTIITKQLRFKLKAKLSLSATCIAGAVSIGMAIGGYGIWSLVAMQLINIFLLMVLMWIKVRWRPGFNFSFKTITKNLRFGVIVSISNFANIFSTRSYVMIIGKYFSVIDAGYFARADSLKNLPAGIFGKIITRVTYPLLSTIQNNPTGLRDTNIMITRFTAVISMPIILGMASVAEELIVILVGERWLASGQILVYLCFAAVFFPLEAINMSIIKAHGNLKTYLYIEMLKIFLVCIVLYVGIAFGIKKMLVAIALNAMFTLCISALVSGKITNNSFLDYCRELWQPVAFSIFMFLAVNFIQSQLNLNYFNGLIVSTIVGGMIIIALYELFKNREYLTMKAKVFKNKT